MNRLALTVVVCVLVSGVQSVPKTKTEIDIPKTRAAVIPNPQRTFGKCNLGDLVVSKVPFSGNSTVGYPDTGITPRDVLNHIVRSLPLSKIQSALTTPLSHVDGRSSNPVMSVVGADAGQFLLLLGSLEDILDRPLNDMQVASMLSDFILISPKAKFNFQTDTLALNRLCRTMKFCFPEYRIDRPPVNMIMALRKELLKSENQGCAFFAHILANPKDYGIRQGLTESFLTAFYNLLWGFPINKLGTQAMAIIHSRINLVVLEGAHTERGMLQIRTSECSPNYIPMLVPEIDGISLFLEYPNVAEYNLIKLAEFGASEGAKWTLFGPQEGHAKQDILDAMISLSEKSFAVAQANNRGRTPIFSIEWPSECCATEKLPDPSLGGKK